MTEAVIVSTARTPIGRAFKGSLKDVRPDDLSVQVDPRRAGQDPRARPDASSRTSTGAAPSRRAEHGSNMARVVAVLAGFDGLPGVDDQPVLRLVGADHADGLPRDQGRRGRHLHLRPASSASRSTPTSPAPAASDGDDQNPRVRRRRRPAAQQIAETNETWTDPREDGLLPDVYLAMGQTAENVATLRGISRERQDEWGVTAQNRAEKAIADGFFEREITPVTLADGTVVSKDDGPRAGVTLEARAGPASRCSASRAPSPPATAARSTTAPPRSSS